MPWSASWNTAASNCLLLLAKRMCRRSCCASSVCVRRRALWPPCLIRTSHVAYHLSMFGDWRTCLGRLHSFANVGLLWTSVGNFDSGHSCWSRFTSLAERSATIRTKLRDCRMPAFFIFWFGNSKNFTRVSPEDSNIHRHTNARHHSLGFIHDWDPLFAQDHDPLWCTVAPADSSQRHGYTRTRKSPKSRHNTCLRQTFRTPFSPYLLIMHRVTSSDKIVLPKLRKPDHVGLAWLVHTPTKSVETLQKNEQSVPCVQRLPSST